MTEETTIPMSTSDAVTKANELIGETLDFEGRLPSSLIFAINQDHIEVAITSEEACVRARLSRNGLDDFANSLVKMVPMVAPLFVQLGYQVGRMNPIVDIEESEPGCFSVRGPTHGAEVWPREGVEVGPNQPNDDTPFYLRKNTEAPGGGVEAVPVQAASDMISTFLHRYAEVLVANPNTDLRVFFETEAAQHAPTLLEFVNIEFTDLREATVAPG